MNPSVKCAGAVPSCATPEDGDSRAFVGGSRELPEHEGRDDGCGRIENADGKRWRFEDIDVAGEPDFETTARGVVVRANGYIRNKRVRTVIVEFDGERRPFSVEELQRAH